MNVGGPALQALILTERLDPTRFDSVLLSGESGPREGDALQLRHGRELSVIRVPGLRREISPVGDVAALLRILRAFRAFRPDIVHTHMAKAGALGRLAARLAGVPIVVHTYHGNVLSGYFDAVRSTTFFQAERFLGRLSSAVVAISPRQKQELERLRVAPSAKIVEIPLGIELEPFLRASPGSLRAELGADPDIALVGIVARLVPVKSVHHFLEAAAVLVQRGVGARFVIVGDGYLRDEMEQRAAALGVADACAFLGWRSDLPSIVADLDVVVLTSRNEGYPVSLIEALAAGRAIVATEVGGVPDLIKHETNGLLVGYGDVPGLVNAIQRLLGDRALRGRLGERGRRDVYPAHDARTLVANMESLYERLASDHGLVGRRQRQSAAERDQ